MEHDTARFSLLRGADDLQRRYMGAGQDLISPDAAQLFAQRALHP
jgi:hypothetical protein